MTKSKDLTVIVATFYLITFRTTALSLVRDEGMSVIRLC